MNAKFNMPFAFSLVPGIALYVYLHTIFLIVTARGAHRELLAVKMDAMRRTPGTAAEYIGRLDDLPLFALMIGTPAPSFLTVWLLTPRNPIGDGICVTYTLITVGVAYSLLLQVRKILPKQHEDASHD